MPLPCRRYAAQAEWLEADGLGGFAGGTVGGARSRRYHALLLTATTPPTGRMVLVNGVEVWVATRNGRFALSSQRYAPGIVDPDGADRLVDFAPEPWPTWRYRLPEGTEITAEIVVAPDHARTVLRWRRTSGEGSLQIEVRPLLSGRDYHALQRENAAFDFNPEQDGARLVWRSYPGVPAVAVTCNASYRHEPVWYRNFLYEEEQERGMDCIEDLASPGSFTFDLDHGSPGYDDRSQGGAGPTATPSDGAVMILAAGDEEAVQDAGASAREIFAAEARRRGTFALPLHRAAQGYVVRRGQGRSVLAGFPWFTDWGRDTFITLRGFMTLPGGRELARDILLAWAGAESQGMLPNLFTDGGAVAPAYNSVDAALWFVVAVHEFLGVAKTAPAVIDEAGEATLHAVIRRIIAGYRKGTRHNIRVDDDGLVAAGEPGVQLTWMDAKVGDWVVTPRIGKPVEIQALWFNALRIAAEGPADLEACRRLQETFLARFWNKERGCLNDVVDVDHVPGRCDPSLRPNQILAVGGLPYPILEAPHAAKVVAAVEAELVTPVGLRSLGPREPGYHPRYEGGLVERDGAYHQGTVWPWLIGPFVEAWVRVRGGSEAARREADRRFLTPLTAELGHAGLGHLSEIHDAEPPHRPRGCPFQAWSMGEFLRLRAFLDSKAGSAGLGAMPIDDGR